MKQNVFWGKMVHKNISFGNINYSIVKITKSANFLKEEQWLGELLKITSKVTGRQFFKEFTKLLCHTFNSEYSFIARRVADDDSKLKIFYWNGDKINHHYIKLKNSFVQNAFRGVTSYYPELLSELFPNDQIVKDTGANSFMGTPIFDVSGQTLGVIGILSKGTMEEVPNSRYMLSILSQRAGSEIQRIRSKELLRQQTRELAEINLMKDKLISVITSDLHAPLKTILGYSEMLRNNSAIYSPEELSRKMKAMDNTLRNLYVFLENLADWNNLQQGEIKYELKTNNIRNILDDIKPYYAYLGDLKQISIQNRVPAVLNIHADSYLARVAIRNTATYLIKNTMKKGAVIFDSVLQDGKWYLVLKSDRFTADIEDVKFCLEALPEELYNAPKDSSVPVLGLFNAREFMKLQGGSIHYKQDGEMLELWFKFEKK